MTAELLAAFVLGLLGAGHCLGMCGGITAALSFAIPKQKKGQRVFILAAYNIGRISSYALIGASAAYITSFVSGGTSEAQPIASFPIQRVVAGVFLILMGLYLADIWRVLTVLERMGKGVWRFVQPLSAKLMPVDSFLKALLFGALWGWLPCGLVYSALAYASVQEHTLTGGLVMLAFGLGTFPAVFAGGYAVNSLAVVLRGRWFKYMSALLLILFGLWTIAGALQHAGHHHGDAASDEHHGHH